MDKIYNKIHEVNNDKEHFGGVVGKGGVEKKRKNLKKKII